MNIQAVLISSLLIFYSDKPLKRMPFAGDKWWHKIIIRIILFLYVAGLFFYFSILNIEFDETKKKEWRRYLLFAFCIGILCIALFISVSDYFPIRKKVEGILGFPDRHINEYTIMTAAFLIGISILYIIELF